MPVAKTTALASPETIEVPASTMFSAWIISATTDGSAMRSLGHRFAGDRRVVDANPERFDQAAVRRDVVALLQQDDLARDELVREQPHRPALAQDVDLLRQQVSQRGKRALDPELLPERKQPTDQDDRHDRVAHLGHAVGRVAPFGQKGQRRCEPQDQGEEVSELLQKAQEHRFAGNFLHPIGAILG